MMIILVGKPASGKSTLIKELDPSLVHISQDLLGSRSECIKKTHEALKAGLSVVIDRTNINKQQRKYFIDVAKQYEVSVQCIELVVLFGECLKRIDQREDHPTVDKDLSLDEKSKIIKFFDDMYEEPTMDEGFSSINVRIYQPG